MYSIIQKIYEKNNKILKEGLKKVLSGEDVSSLTVAIKEFTDVLGKELFSEIAKQLDEIIFEDNKKKKQYEPVRFQEKSLITKNGKTKFERRYYQDKETGEYCFFFLLSSNIISSNCFAISENNSFPKISVNSFIATVRELTSSPDNTFFNPSFKILLFFS